MYRVRNTKRYSALMWIFAALCLAVSYSVTAQPTTTTLVDPMQPPGVAASHGHGPASWRSRYILSSTFITRDRKSAIISGRRVTVGDIVGDARVIEILPTKVRLRRGARTVTLRLLPLTIKKPALSE